MSTDIKTLPRYCVWLAKSYAALADLVTERDIANQAVGYDVRGLAIRLDYAAAGRCLERHAQERSRFDRWRASILWTRYRKCPIPAARAPG
jgi:hypothetical protein